jgi:hypothetical protein
MLWRLLPCPRILHDFETASSAGFAAKFLCQVYASRYSLDRRHVMDFETAVRIAPEVEHTVPGLNVIGIRRMSQSRPHDSWALDIIEPRTGRMITLDEKDDWDRFLHEIPAETAIPASVRSGAAQVRTAASPAPRETPASRPSRETGASRASPRNAASPTPRETVAPSRGTAADRPSRRTAASAPPSRRTAPARPSRRAAAPPSRPSRAASTGTRNGRHAAPSRS